MDNNNNETNNSNPCWSKQIGKASYKQNKKKKKSFTVKVNRSIAYLAVDCARNSLLEPLTDNASDWFEWQLQVVVEEGAGIICPFLLHLVPSNNNNKGAFWRRE